MRHRFVPVICALLLGALTTSAFAADHIDSPSAVAEPTADITDLFAWMTSDAEMLNLAIGVFPFAGAEAAFSPAVGYAFHINSSQGYGEDATETTLICAFADPTTIECWLGDEYLSGDPRDPAGITSASGMIRVFAGPRNDPFFMENVGFNETVKTVVGAAPSLEFDADGCPAVDEATSGVLLGQLASGADGAAASDTFAGTNVLALVIQVDKTLVNSGGPLLGVWASTHSL